MGESLQPLSAEPVSEAPPAAPPAIHSPPMGQPSLGSMQHGAGCEPCAFAYKPDGCKKGFLCKFCHLCPRGEIKQRKREKKIHRAELKNKTKERSLQTSSAVAAQTYSRSELPLDSWEVAHEAMDSAASDH